MFNKKYNTNHYELSVNINVVYEIDDVLISNLYGNDNYAAWTEFTKDSIIYAYYDKQENQPYELLTLPFISIHFCIVITFCSSAISSA